jgi:hypothetical protein
MVVATGSGERNMRSYCLIGKISVLQDEKSSGDWWL